MTGVTVVGVRGHLVAVEALADDIIPSVRKMGALLVLASLVACDGGSSTTEDVEKVRSAADAMEESGPFAVEMILDLEMPEALTSVESTIHGRIDLSAGRSTFEGRSKDGDA